jgi:hypothetical protein
MITKALATCLMDFEYVNARCIKNSNMNIHVWEMVLVGVQAPITLLRMNFIRQSWHRQIKIIGANS